MVNLSPYADAESGAPSWRTGERESAIVFLSLALYIILDVNVSIYRVFRKKRGLYYWSLIFATWGTAIVVVGNILKNFKPEWTVIWPLNTALINGGWSIYAPAELLILYSRIHLVNQNDRLHRALLIMIIVGSTLIIIPNWVFIFPAYDIDPAISSEWSPRMAIIDRVSQAGFTLFEIVLSGVYIHSLRDILRTKLNTRTRRVMRDLILVNVTVICMDLLVIILIFLNQANLAYPLQDLTYAFKYKIEFVVLNQLMALAASGSRHGSRQSTWEEKRYRRPGHATILKGYSDDDLTGVRLPFLSTSTGSKASPQSTVVANEKDFKTLETTDFANVTKPPSIITKHQVGTISNMSDASLNSGDVRAIDQHFAFQPDPNLAIPTDPSNFDNTSRNRRSLEERDSNDGLLAPIADDEKNLTLARGPEPSSRTPHQEQRNRLSLRQGIFRKSAAADFHMLNSSKSTPNTDENDRDKRKRIAPFSSSSQDLVDLTANQSKASPQTPPARPSNRRFGSKSKPRKIRRTEDEDDAEDDLYIWERPRTGKSALELPWFYMRNEGAASSPEMRMVVRESQG